MQAFIVTGFPFSTALSISCGFWCIVPSFGLNKDSLKFRVLFILRMCEFSRFLLLIFSFLALWLEKILGMISVAFHLLRLVLWRSMLYVLGMLLRTWEESVFCCGKARCFACSLSDPLWQLAFEVSWYY